MTALPVKNWLEGLPLEFIARRYDKLAPFIKALEWVFFLPRQLRARAVQRLGLKAGGKVLEVGCGTGRNFTYLRRAVGPGGGIYGVDVSPGMLRVAAALCEKNRWSNVTLVEEDAARYAPPELVDGVLFGLSYNTMPNRFEVLQRAWSQLKPGGRLVIMEAKVPSGRSSKLALAIGIALNKVTTLGNPLVHPWKDIQRVVPKEHLVTMEEYRFGSYYILSTKK